MPWKTVRTAPVTDDAEGFCWWCGRDMDRGAEAHVLVPASCDERRQELPRLCSPICAKRYADYAPPEAMAAASALGRVFEAGATLDDVLGGEEGRRWVEEACAGDVALAKEAFLVVYPKASFALDPVGAPYDVVRFPNPEERDR